MATAMAANIIGFLKPTSLCYPIPTRSIQAKCCGFLRFRTESPRMNRHEDIFDSCALASWACPAKVESPPLSAALQVMIATELWDVSAGRRLSQG
jgi:hypothetical protein